MKPAGRLFPDLAKSPEDLGNGPGRAVKQTNACLTNIGLQWRHLIANLLISGRTRDHNNHFMFIRIGSIQVIGTVEVLHFESGRD